MIALGNVVKDSISGLVGTATCHINWLYGCARYGIEPSALDKDGKVESVKWFDEQRVEFVEKGHPNPNQFPHPRFALGSKAKDILTGFEGIISATQQHLYHPGEVHLEPTTLDKDGKVREGTWFSEQRIALIEVKKPPVSKDSRATTGGPQNDPSSRANRP